MRAIILVVGCLLSAIYGCDLIDGGDKLARFGGGFLIFMSGVLYTVYTDRWFFRRA